MEYLIIYEAIQRLIANGCLRPHKPWVEDRRTMVKVKKTKLQKPKAQPEAFLEYCTTHAKEQFVKLTAHLRRVL